MKEIVSSGSLVFSLKVLAAVAGVYRRSIKIASIASIFSTVVLWLCASWIAGGKPTRYQIRNYFFIRSKLRGISPIEIKTVKRIAVTLYQ